MGIFSIYRHHLQNSANRHIIETLMGPKTKPDIWYVSGEDRDAKEIAKLDKQIAALQPGHPDIKFLLQSRKIYEDGFHAIEE